MPSPVRKSRQNPLLRREQILKAALEVFLHRGYSAATIREIAALAGTAPGTLYLYYPGKRQLYVAVIENLMVRPLLDIIGPGRGKEFPSTLHDALRDRFNFLRNDSVGNLSRLIGEIQRDGELRELLFTGLIRPFLSRMEEYYRLHIASGELRQFEPSLVVRLIGSLMLGSTILRNLEGEASPFNRLPPEKVVDEILNFILHGILARHDTAGPGRRIRNE